LRKTALSTFFVVAVVDGIGEGRAVTAELTSEVSAIKE
jgi:hypothetical protein